MKRLAFTPVTPLDNEARRIAATLDSGWDMVHLRHPSLTLRDMRRIIEAIPQRLHSRIRLHGHFQLLNEFNLGGIQLNSRLPQPPEGYTGPYSRSCHTIEEALQSTDCDYVTLSPIFDSVSKAGYKAAFTEKELSRIDKTHRQGVIQKVIALGGVTPELVAAVQGYGFDGFATLGMLLGAPDYDTFTRNLDLFNRATKQLTD